MTADDLVQKLHRLDAELGDARDVVMTPAAQEKFYGRKASIARTISALRNLPDDLAAPRAELAELERVRTIVVQAQAEVERLIAEQTDYRTLGDSRARDREWGRQLDLLASRRALVHGVEYMGGVACVPNALKKILGVVVEPDGREVPNWYGYLGYLDGRVAELTRRVFAAQNALDHYVKAAEELLAVTA